MFAFVKQHCQSTVASLAKYVCICACFPVGMKILLIFTKKFNKKSTVTSWCVSTPD